MKFNPLIPELSVSNLNASLTFYIEVLGFKLEYERKEDRFVFLSINQSQLMLYEDNDNWVTGEYSYPRGRGMNLQIELSSIYDVYEKIKSNNYKIFREPTTYRRRVCVNYIEESEFLVQDPDGYLLRFSSEI